MVPEGKERGPTLPPGLLACKAHPSSFLARDCKVKIQLRLQIDFHDKEQ